MKSEWVIVAILVLAFFWTERSEAAEKCVTLTWEPPTQRVNGDALPLNEIDRFEIESTRPGASEPTILTAGPDQTQRQHCLDFPTGETTLTYRIRTVDTFALSSVWSDPAEWMGVVAPDSAPQKIEIFLGGNAQ